MLMDDFDVGLIIETDELMASGDESPLKDGFQSLSYELQEEVIDWLRQHCEPSKRVNIGMTSNNLAEHCGKDMSDMGLRRKVSNLAIKTAMSLLGYEPTVKPVTFHHYRFRYRREPKGGSMQHEKDELTPENQSEIAHSVKQDKDELSPENKKALAHRFVSEVGLPSHAADYFEFNSVAQYERALAAVKEDERQRQVKARMYSPYVDLDGTHPAQIETRSSAEIFADFLSQHF